MSEKKKNQHYVPKCYLKSWCMPNSNQLNVYDKGKRKVRVNHIDDVASENYFYDLDFSGTLSEETIKNLGLEGVDLSKIDEGQYLENYFSNNVEGAYKTLLQRIINKVMSMSAWEIKNCYFISEEDLIGLSYFIAIQFIRVKSVRDSIADSADCLDQALIDMGVPETLRKKYWVSEQKLKIIHAKMLVNKKQIIEETMIFGNHIWILLFNKTSQPFYTSDNPIGTIEHIKDPIFSMSGIACKGVEIFFPISPKLMLVMFEREYHSDKNKYDKRIIEIDNVEDVRRYNARSVLNSLYCTYSPDDDFSIVDDMLKKNPNILDRPRSVVHGGGKDYFPQKR